MAADRTLKSDGARTQPCLTPFVTGKGSENAPFSITLAIIPSWTCFTLTANFCQDLPQTVPTHCVECLSQVYKDAVEVIVLFSAFFLNLSGRKDHGIYLWKGGIGHLHDDTKIHRKTQLGAAKMCMMDLKMFITWKHKCDWNVCGSWNVRWSISKVE